MAVIDYEELQPDAGAEIPAGTRVFRWPATDQAFADGDTGKPLDCGQYADKTIQVRSSNFNSATVTIQGANHPQDASRLYDTLHDAAGNALALTAVGIAAILENPFVVRPLVAGGAPTALQIILYVTTPARR